MEARFQSAYLRTVTEMVALKQKPVKASRRNKTGKSDVDEVRDFARGRAAEDFNILESEVDRLYAKWMREVSDWATAEIIEMSPNPAKIFDDWIVEEGKRGRK